MEKYDVISVVGEGSYGLVLRCRHRESGQYVAIKKFLETEDDPTVRKMALREIRMLKKLRHENLVNMIEVFRRKKRFFLVFEYLEHTVLEELEARAGGLGSVTSRKYIYQVLRALDFIHSHNVIHRDIKPENVLVSRLGVIKLCDFGFARPYLENETFTDYVATRWYRSPELLVGDRYGKEVDIWAVGCLYSEMMTGEPLFPGESDIDQLYQIVRVVGKVSPRHQILMIRNSMFKGMKQEQNTSLSQLFPEWNRDSLDFLTQCLKMDGMTRPDTTKLLKHDLFTRDNFIEHFLVELKSKLTQEMQVNPLLKRIPSYGSSRRGSDEKKSLSQNQQRDVEKKSSGDGQIYVKSKVNLLALNNQQVTISNKNTKSENNNNLENMSVISNSAGGGGGSSSKQNNNENEEDLKSHKETSEKQFVIGGLLSSNNQTKLKQINFSNLKLKENDKYARVASAKAHKISTDNGNALGSEASNRQNQFEYLIQPQSPVHFQSLQHETSTNHHDLEHLQPRRLSPVAVINQTTSNNSKTMSINNRVPLYFNTKRNANILTLENLSAQKVTNSYLKQNQLSQFVVGRSNGITKRERERPHQLLDISLMPLNNPIHGTTTSTATHVAENIPINKDTLKEPSPRILPPPPWLTGNLKLTAQGKNTQIGNSTNGKRRITDWKSVGINGNAIQRSNHDSDLVFPNCPGATVSPQKSNTFTKKKLSPMSTLTQNSSNNNNSSNSISNTPRNFSASSDHINET